MLIDPLGKDPIVVSGSANFSRRLDEREALVTGGPAAARRRAFGFQESDARPSGCAAASACSWSRVTTAE